jgi:hypothetical protein
MGILFEDRFQCPAMPARKSSQNHSSSNMRSFPSSALVGGEGATPWDVRLLVLMMSSLACSGIGASINCPLSSKSGALLGTLCDSVGLNCWKRIAMRTSAVIVPSMPQNTRKRPSLNQHTISSKTKGKHTSCPSLPLSLHLRAHFDSLPRIIQSLCQILRPILPSLDPLF